LVVNLRTAYETQTLTNDLKNYSKYVANISVQPVENVSNFTIQMRRINELKEILRRFLAVNPSLPGNNSIVVTPNQQPINNTTSIKTEPNQQTTVPMTNQ
jgi:hypothetical protein